MQRLGISWVKTAGKGPVDSNRSVDWGESLHCASPAHRCRNNCIKIILTVSQLGTRKSVHWTPLHICFCLQIKTPLQGGTMLLINEVCHQSGGWSCDPQWTEWRWDTSLTGRTLWVTFRGFSTDVGLLGWDFGFRGALSVQTWCNTSMQCTVIAVVRWHSCE